MVTSAQVLSWVQARRVQVGLFFVLLVALGLRLVNLGAEPYWGDEVLSLGIIRHFESVADLVRYVSLVEIHPPLYYITMHYWVEWFGEAEAATRSLSVIFSLGIVGLTYFMGKLMFRSAVVGLLAASIVAVLPLQIEMGTDARPYVFFGFFNLLSVIAYWQYRERRQWPYLLLYVLGAVVAIYFHYTGALATIALAIVWLIDIARTADRHDRHTELVRWLVAHAAIAVLFAPWLPFLLSKSERQSLPIFGISSDKAGVLLRSLRAESSFRQMIWTTKEVYVTLVEIIAIWLAKAALAVGALVAVYRWGAGKTSVDEHERKGFLFLGLLAGLGLVIYLVYPASVGYTDISERHGFILTVYYALLMAALLVRVPVRLARIIVLIFFVSLTTFVMNIIGDDGRWDPSHRLKATAEFINDNYREGDLVLVQNAFLRTDFNYYLREDTEAVAFYPPQYDGHDLYNTRDTLGMIENDFQFRITVLPPDDLYPKFDRIIEKYQPKRVWVAYFFDPYADIWFTGRGWHKQFYSASRILPLSLFVPPGQVAQ